LSSKDASQDDPLAVKLAEGIRSTSARDAFSFGYFSLGMQRKVTRQQGERNFRNIENNMTEEYFYIFWI